MTAWEEGEVMGHVGGIHRVATGDGIYWCELDDLLPASPERAGMLTPSVRVWARWLDGRWYPGAIDGVQGGLRHVSWDDGDSMWLEASHAVLLVAGEHASVGSMVLAPHWGGDLQPARIEEEEAGRFRLVFADGEEGWLPEDELQVLPQNPFLD